MLLKRNKIAEICKNDFDMIVNMTRKYALPDCIKKEKIKIDNFDFLQHGTQFLFLEDKKFQTKKIHPGRETKRDEEGDFGDDAKTIDGDF